MATTDGSSRADSDDEIASTCGKFLSTKARRSALESTTYRTWQPLTVEKLRRRFGPQYPQPNWARVRVFILEAKSHRSAGFQFAGATLQHQLIGAADRF